MAKSALPGYLVIVSAVKLPLGKSFSLIAEGAAVRFCGLPLVASTTCLFVKSLSLPTTIPDAIAVPPLVLT